MSGKAKTIKASDFAAALLACTILAGIPGTASAQDAVAPAPAAPPPAPAREQHVIRSITIVGAQRLEPATIRSYIKLLRQKIEPNPPEPRFLRTVHGVGYALEVGS